MKSQKMIRDQFLAFFRERDHAIMPSAPVVPIDDPTLLFTNAGMNQFKNIFLGTGRAPHPRVADTQKCLRVSGKHNDLDEVGRDTYHHTFFEMLGNWSFGDYFKREAILWAWEFLTGTCGIEKEKLYATYFGGDDREGTAADTESRDIWPEVTGIAPSRVLPFGKKDNFWEMGEVGPCGPCSEIHIDLGESFCDKKHLAGHRCAVNGGCARFIEIWNLVFIQFNRKKDGSLMRLEKNHVDTGMGFERLVGIVEGTHSNYDTDLFRPLFEALKEITGFGYKEHRGEIDVALRVVADHVKALCFAIADGAIPEKKGRGSVLRSLLRRAARFGRQVLAMKEPFIYRLPPVVGTLYHDIFPNVMERLGHIEGIVREEEELFALTLDRGLGRFAAVVESLGGRTVLDGSEAYRLYHQDGFPRDLIDQMAGEQGLAVDEEGWKKAEEEHRERSKGEARQEPFSPDDLVGLASTEFTGYWEQEGSEELGFVSKARPLKLVGRQVLILDRTPFYAEAGGQVGDSGTIAAPGFTFRVDDTKKSGDYIVHIGELVEGAGGPLPPGVEARVDAGRRKGICANHTATHLLHWALREVLGPHATQQGSEVNPLYLRFDVTHPQAITPEELQKIESLVNERICDNIPLAISIKRLDEAKSEGVTALFGEKYGDLVRVIDIGGFSRELCGGTHTMRTGDLGFFYLASESSSEAGVRRIEAMTGMGSLARIQEVRSLLRAASASLNAQPSDVPARIEGMITQVKELKKMKAREEKKDLKALREELLDKALHAGGARIVLASFRDIAPAALGELADELRGGPVPVCGIITSGEKDNLVIIGFASKALAGKIHIGNLVKETSAFLGGGGGGRPDFAKGGGRHGEKLEEALAMAGKKLEEGLGHLD
ncbi:MAG: alanine--tRNA ligase [Candidatus Eremiobacteraeota bacterium]|nr:alanine--tRNA ligase [Candidatus Eremiobacteraeota bacterium]